MIYRISSPEEAVSNPIGLLRDRQPGLFEAPDFWVSDLASIEQQLCQAKRGRSFQIGTSSGGLPIWAISYGSLEPQEATATISSAMASDRPEAFYNPARRTRPSLVLIGSIHGGETEGIAACMNVINLLETGVDLRGQSHPRLHDLLGKVRLVLVPCLNPDGRRTAGVAHLNGAKIDDLFLVQQGLLADGTPFRGRKVKEIQPIPEGHLSHLGGYYNSEGVNLQHDDFFGPKLAPENQAIMKLFRDEVPDAFMTLHAHGAPAAFLTPDAFIAPGYQRKQLEAVGFILARLAAKEIPFVPPDQIPIPPWNFYFQTWLHHMTGALPLLFEFCHGLEGLQPCSLEQTVDTGLLITEAWVEYCLTFGARPSSLDFFGPAIAAR